MGRCVDCARKMKKRIAIIGSTGMLGSMMYKCFREKYSLVIVYKDKAKLKKLEDAYGSTKGHTLVQLDIQELAKDFLTGFPKFSHSLTSKLKIQIGTVDKVINCAGIIKPHALRNPQLTYFVNSAFPHLLSGLYGEKLIQITTDCVFDGLHGAPYDEDSVHTPNDLYGLTKSLGEPSMNSLVLRTSIIGPEINGGVSLLEWFLEQEGQVNGYINHKWNGITTKEFAKICDKIISYETKFPKIGLYHIFGSDITKYEMLIKFKERYNLPVKVKRVKADYSIDRRLVSKFNLSKKLSIPDLDQMLADL